MDSARVFNTAMNLKKEELYVGVHEIQMTTEVNKFVTTMHYNFKIRDTFIIPTPTPQITRKIVAMDDGEIKQRETPTIAPVSEIIIQDYERPTYVPTPTPESYVIVGSPAPNTTIPVPTPTKDQNITVPLPTWLGIMALVIVVMRKR
jgi:hypothetical protein